MVGPVEHTWTEQDETALLTVTWERQETSREHFVGPDRGGPGRRKTTQTTTRYQTTSVTRDETAIEGLVARMVWQAERL